MTYPCGVGQEGGVEFSHLTEKRQAKALFDGADRFTWMAGSVGG